MRPPRPRPLALALGLLALGTLSACRGAGEDATAHLPSWDDPDPSARGPVRLVRLGPDVEPLRARFNADADRARLVLLLSPTCPRCREVVDCLNEGLLRRTLPEDLSVIAVWQDVMAADDLAACPRAAARFQQDRVAHFHDCLHTAGRALTAGRLPVAMARHLYLLYPAGVRWEGTLPPEPEDWAHGLPRFLPERRVADLSEFEGWTQVAWTGLRPR